MPKRALLMLCLLMLHRTWALRATPHSLLQPPLRAQRAVYALAKAAKKKRPGAASSHKGFGAPPPPPPPTAASVEACGPRLVPIDLGKGQEVSVMLPPQRAAEEPNDAALRRLEGDALSRQGVLSLYQHLYGAGDVVWPASVALARLLCHVPSITAGRRVLELGCGLGAAGLAAARAGASAVTLTDRDPAVLELAAQAADANGVGAVVGTAALEWSADAAALRAVLGSEPYDVIVGADVLYDEATARALAALLARLLPADAPPQRCVLADPPQRGGRAAFAAACAEHGLAMSDEPLPGPEGARMLIVARAEDAGEGGE